MQTLHYRSSSSQLYEPKYRRKAETLEITPPMRRRTTQSRTEAHGPTEEIDGPWQHMAQTYTWVAEQEFAQLENSKKNKKTEQWVLQQIYLAENGDAKGRKKLASIDALPRQMWDEVTYKCQAEAELWMRQEAQARQFAVEREKEKARAVQEEIRRLEDRINLKREKERIRRAHERLRAYEAFHENERKERVKADREMLDSWSKYDANWTTLMASSNPLTFKNIPWPLKNSPRVPDEIAPAAIVMFIFSPLHSQSQSRKDRIRSAQLRWHPDRFRRLMGRVVPEDKEAIEKAVGIVARCLNDLMGREGNNSAHTR